MVCKVEGLRNAWLSPQGEIVTDAEDFDPRAWHEDLAACIVRDREGISHAGEVYWHLRQKGFDYTYEYLESIGWVRLCGRGGTFLKWIIPNRLTARQREVIECWCAANGKMWSDTVDEDF
jgi:hypothetical protein